MHVIMTHGIYRHHTFTYNFFACIKFLSLGPKTQKAPNLSKSRTPAFAILGHLRNGVLGVLDVSGQEGEDVEGLLRQGLQYIRSAPAPSSLHPPLDRLQFGVHPEENDDVKI